MNVRRIQGYKGIGIVDINPPLALATFDAPMQGINSLEDKKKSNGCRAAVHDGKDAMQIRYQNKNPNLPWKFARQHHRDIKTNRIRVASIATSLPWQMWEVIWESNGLPKTLRMKACTRLWKLLFLSWNRNNCTKEGCAKGLTPDIDNANHRNE